MNINLDAAIQVLEGGLGYSCDELRAADKDAALWRDLVSHQKFNNHPAVGYAINRTRERHIKHKEKQ